MRNGISAWLALPARKHLTQCPPVLTLALPLIQAASNRKEGPSYIGAVETAEHKLLPVRTRGRNWSALHRKWLHIPSAWKGPCGGVTCVIVFMTIDYSYSNIHSHSHISAGHPVRGSRKMLLLVQYLGVIWIWSCGLKILASRFSSLFTFTPVCSPSRRREAGGKLPAGNVACLLEQLRSWETGSTQPP